MRRHPAVLLLAIGLSAALVTGCSSSAQPKTTRTEVVTVTGTAPPGGSVTVISPVSPTSGSATGTATGSGSATGTDSATGSASGTASTPAASQTGGDTATSPTSPAATSPTTTATTATGPIVKVNPLKVDCAQLLDAQDVKKALGVSISTSVTRIVDVANADIGRTGLIRCRYGATSTSGAAPVSVALADYGTPAQAQAQLKKTLETLGGSPTSANVAGHPATVIIDAGGLLVMTYDTWTLSLAVADKLAPNAQLPDALTQLSTLVFNRVLKSA